MELIEIKCEHCGKEIHIYDSYVKEHMYCTIGCLESSSMDNTY